MVEGVSCRRRVEGEGAGGGGGGKDQGLAMITRWTRLTVTGVRYGRKARGSSLHVHQTWGAARALSRDAVGRSGGDGDRGEVWSSVRRDGANDEVLELQAAPHSQLPNLILAVVGVGGFVYRSNGRRDAAMDGKAGRRGWMDAVGFKSPHKHGAGDTGKRLESGRERERQSYN